MKSIFSDFCDFYSFCKKQDFAFYMACMYLIFSYLRPQAIYPVLDILPWTQLSIVSGLIYLGMKGRIRLQSTHVILFIFFLIVIASSFQSYYPETSFNNLSVVYIWLIEVIFFTNCIKNLEQFKAITILFFIIIFKMSLFGAKTWVLRGFGFTKWGIAGPSGFFANSGEFSLLMAIVAVISLAYLLSQKEVKKIYFLLPITASMTILGASSRGSQIALIIALLIIAITIEKLRIKNILYFVLASYLAFTFIPQEQKERIINMGDDNTSQSRLEYWGAGLDMMNNNPFLGVGHYGFADYYQDNYTFQDDRAEFLISRKEVAHNSLIQVGSSLGYTGLLCYVYMMYLCYSLNKKTRDMIRKNTNLTGINWAYKYSKGLDIALVTYFIGSFFMSIAFYPYIYLLMMFSQTLNNSITNVVKQPEISQHRVTE